MLLDEVSGITGWWPNYETIVTVRLVAKATDLDNDSLLYEYSSTEGKISGEGKYRCVPSGWTATSATSALTVRLGFAARCEAGLCPAVSLVK